MQDINFIKAKATAAAEFLANHGIVVKHTVMLEMLSRLEGYRNWSTFREQLAVTPAASAPPTLQQALTLCYRWMSLAPNAELEAVERAIGEDAPVAMATEALKAAGKDASEGGSTSKESSWTAETGTMTDAQYTARRGCRCPSCGSHSIEGAGRLEGEGGSAGQNVACSECGATWTDTYSLTGYCELEGGINFEAIASVVEDVKSRAEKYAFNLNSESQARECVDESCDLIEPLLREIERNLAVKQLMA